VDDNILHTEERIQLAAGACLRDFLAGCAGGEVSSRIRKYCEYLFDHAPNVRRGGAIALAAFPRRLLCPSWRYALKQLCKAIDFDTVADKRDVDARVKAIEVSFRACYLLALIH
jgi:hypothetical protein